MLPCLQIRSVGSSSALGFWSQLKNTDISLMTKVRPRQTPGVPGRARNRSFASWFQVEPESGRASEALGSRLETHIWGPRPLGILIQSVWSENLESAFFKSSLWVWWRSRFRNHTDLNYGVLHAQAPKGNWLFLGKNQPTNQPREEPRFADGMTITTNDKVEWTETVWIQCKNEFVG